jgi:DNA-binding transcriptional regulator YiaG
MSTKKHRTRVGRYTVEDGSLLSDPDGDLTLGEIEALELRAARTVLLDVPGVEGDVLRFARKAMGVTQPELGAILGVATETVSRWETGAEPFKRTVQLALAQLLDMAHRDGCDAVKALVEQKPPPSRTLRVG